MKIKDIVWRISTYCEGDNILYTYYLDGPDKLGRRITVLNRVTGFGNGIRDIETGYQDENHKFWLASGAFDIRMYPELTITEAIALIKQHSNTCQGC